MLPQQQRERRKLTRNLTFTFGFPSTAVCTWITLLANTSHISIQQSTEQSPEKKNFIWVSRHFARKYYYFYVSNWKWDRHFTWSFEPRGGLAACTAKGVPSFLSYFKTLSISGPGNRTRDLPLCSQALILPRWDDVTLIFFGDYNDEHIRLIWKMIKR